MTWKLQAPSQIMNNDEILRASRSRGVVYVEGKPVETGVFTYEITGAVVPLNGRDLLLVPEGDRHKEQYFIFSENLSKEIEINDRVVRGGINFQVQSVEPWGSFYRARIMRDDVGPNKAGS